MADGPTLDRAAFAARLGIHPESVGREVRRGQIPGPDASVHAEPGDAPHTVTRYHAEVAITAPGPDGKPTRRTMRCDHDHDTRRTAMACARGLAAAARTEEWSRRAIDAWEKTRPGKGAGAGRPRKDAGRSQEQ